MITLGIDLGTTHLKAGLFDAQLGAIRIVRRPTIAHQDEDGYFVYEPDEIFSTILDLLDDLLASASPAEIGAIGIASMAETGLLFDVKNTRTLSPFIPWFDKRATLQAKRVEAEADVFEWFTKTGLRPNAKYGLCKILWLQEQLGDIPKDAIWLSMADYIAYRLTGVYGTDHTLAARTHAFRIDTGTWDEPWLRHFGLQARLFPPVFRSGQPIGKLLPAFVQRFGCKTPPNVCIAGHDHLCSAVGSGLFASGQVLDSMGTAETLLGFFAKRPLTKADYDSGLLFGTHVIHDQMFWLGSVPASGGSVEWFRQKLFHPPLSYEALLQRVQEVAEEPTGILYFPYLSGAGAPKLDERMQGALVGLSQKHTQGHILKAVLEGAAYEVECIRRSAEVIVESPIAAMTVAGGGTQNRTWLQIKADVTGCALTVTETAEAALLGAALLAGIGCGAYAGLSEVAACLPEYPHQTITSRKIHHGTYQQIFHTRYLPMQEALRRDAHVCD